VTLEKDGKISWSDRVKNEEVLQRARKERNIIHTSKIWKANWNDHILRMNWLLKHITERKI
jgi:hypothetical protein